MWLQILPQDLSNTNKCDGSTITVCLLTTNIYIESREAKSFEIETSDGMCGCDVMCILSIDVAEVGQADTCPEVAH